MSGAYSSKPTFKNVLKSKTAIALIAAAGAICGPVSPAALAQDNSATGDVAEEDIIIVEGRRRDLQLSIEAKRNADQVVDVLSAEQTGRLPDNNIAESLGRIPGVSFQRSGETGNGDFISIRGLDSALNNVQFNGVNSGLASDGNRRVPLDGISSEDIAEIRVAKSLLPQDEGEGIGGAVNIVAKTPLGIGEDRLSFDVSGRYGEFADKLGFQAGGGFTKVWNDRIGINLSASYRRRFIHNFELDASSSNIFSLAGIRDAAGNMLTPAEILALGIDDAGTDYDNIIEGLISADDITFEEQSYQLQQQTRDTLTLSGAIDWRPAEHTLLTLGGRLSRRDTDATEFSITFDDDDGDLELVDGILMTEFSDQEIDVEAQLEDQFDVNANAYLKGVTELNRLTLNYQASYARAVGKQPQSDIFFDTAGLLDDGNIQYQPYIFTNTYFPVPNLANLNEVDFTGALADIPGTQEFDGYETDFINQRINDRYAANLNAEYELGWSAFGGVFNTVVLGAKFERSDIREDFSEREFDTDESNLDGSFDADGNGSAEDAFLGDFPGLFGGFEGMSQIGSPLEVIGVQGVPVLNDAAWRQFVANSQSSFIAAGGTPSEVTFFDGREEIYAGYFQTEFEAGNFKLVGGVRVEHYEGDFLAPVFIDAEVQTETDSIQLADTADDIISTSASNTEVLPRFNALYRATDTFQIRGGFGYSIARPTFSQLGDALEIDIALQTLDGLFPGAETAADILAAGGLSATDLDDSTIVISRGNPNLENARSMNADLSFEYYPSRGTALTVGLFYKRIKNFIFVGQERASGELDASIAETFLSTDGAAVLAGLGGLTAFVDAGGIDELAVVQPQNGDTAIVKGVEFGIFHQFDWAPGLLSDVGFFGNVTYTDSEADYFVIAPASASNPDGGLEDDEAVVALGFARAGDGLVRTTSFFNSPSISANGSIYYEANGLELALSGSYQAKQFDFTDDFGLDQFNGRTYQLDFFLGYELPIDESWGQYEVYFEVPDITDKGRKPTDLQTVGRERVAFDEASFNGREFRFGFRGRF